MGCGGSGGCQERIERLAVGRRSGGQPGRPNYAAGPVGRSRWPRAEQQVDVPVAALAASHLAGQPATRDVVRVPQVDHPGVGQAGAVSTLWSGGREEHYQPGLAAVGVEPAWSRPPRAGRQLIGQLQHGRDPLISQPVEDDPMVAAGGDNPHQRRQARWLDTLGWGWPRRRVRSPADRSPCPGVGPEAEPGRKPSRRRDRSTPWATPPQEPASEAGRRVGVGPGLPRRPPSSESHRWRPLLVPPRSREPYPVLPAMNPHCSCRRASAQHGTGTVRPKGSPVVADRFVASLSYGVARSLRGS